MTYVNYDVDVCNLQHPFFLAHPVPYIISTYNEYGQRKHPDNNTHTYMYAHIISRLSILCITVNCVYIYLLFVMRSSCPEIFIHLDPT